MFRPACWNRRAPSAQTADFSNCFQKATEFGQSMDKKQKAAEIDRLLLEA